jgi:hypothetical protein
MRRKIAKRKLRIKDILADSYTVGALTDHLTTTQHLIAVHAVDAGMREDHDTFDELAPSVRQLAYAIALLDKLPRMARVSALLEEAGR